MKKLSLLLVVAVLFASCQKNGMKPAASNGQVEANWSSSDQYGSWANGGYTVNNDIWGSGAGAQNIWANSYSQWGVWANHPNTGGVKSFPNSTRYVGRTLSSLSSCTSTFSATTPAGGAWESTYDIWDSSYANETMLWMNYTGNSDGSGNVKPLSYNYNAAGAAIPVYSNVTVGGSTWNVFRGNNGGNNVYSFLRTTKTNHATVDIKAIQTWIENQGWFGDMILGNVQYGFEITSSWGDNGGGLNYTTNSYSVSFN